MTSIGTIVGETSKYDDNGTTMSVTSHYASTIEPTFGIRLHFITDSLPKNYYFGENDTFLTHTDNSVT